MNLLQSIVSRDVNPAQAAVISVTEIHGGTSYNIIPDMVRLRGTTRHFLPAVQDGGSADAICAASQPSFGVAVDMSYERRYPPLVNTDRETDEAVRAAIMVAGKDRVFTDITPVMTFRRILPSSSRKSRGRTWGSAAEIQKRPAGCHQSQYDFNDRILPVGASYWATLVETLLPK